MRQVYRNGALSPIADTKKVTLATFIRDSKKTVAFGNETLLSIFLSFFLFFLTFIKEKKKERRKHFLAEIYFYNHRICVYDSDQKALCLHHILFFFSLLKYFVLSMFILLQDFVCGLNKEKYPMTFIIFISFL